MRVYSKYLIVLAVALLLYGCDWLYNPYIPELSTQTELTNTVGGSDIVLCGNVALYDDGIVYDFRGKLIEGIGTSFILKRYNFIQGMKVSEGTEPYFNAAEGIYNVNWSYNDSSTINCIISAVDVNYGLQEITVSYCDSNTEDPNALITITKHITVYPKLGFSDNTYDGLFHYAGNQKNLSASLLKGIAKRESNMDADDINYNNNGTNDYGLMGNNEDRYARGHRNFFSIFSAKREGVVYNLQPVS